MTVRRQDQRNFKFPPQHTLDAMLTKLRARVLISFIAMRWGFGDQKIAASCFCFFLLMLESQMIVQSAYAQSKANDRGTTRTNERGRKYVNKIPYDVFFDAPLQLLENNQGPSSVNSLPTRKSSSDAANLQIATRSNTTLWHRLLPIVEIQNEVKTLRGNLSRSLGNQGQFRQNFKAVALDGAELAVLASIVQEHEEPLTWKDQSHLVRHFSQEISQSAVGITKNDFDKTKLAFQNLISVLDGAKLGEVDDVPVRGSFHETASRKPLMKRMEKARDWLKQEVNSEAKMKSLSESIVHEASILSALTTVITKDGYDDTKNEDYQIYAKQLIDGSRETIDATNDLSYERFQRAVDKINKSCTDCHGVYGNS